MTHRTAQQRARARRADPLGGRAAQIAPSHLMPPVVCANPDRGDGKPCGHPRLQHEGGTGQCFAIVCGCGKYVEEQP